jgi:hypothetical protein
MSPRPENGASRSRTYLCVVVVWLAWAHLMSPRPENGASRSRTYLCLGVARSRTYLCLGVVWPAWHTRAHLRLVCWFLRLECNGICIYDCTVGS